MEVGPPEFNELARHLRDSRWCRWSTVSMDRGLALGTVARHALSPELVAVSVAAFTTRFPWTADRSHLFASLSVLLPSDSRPAAFEIELQEMRASLLERGLMCGLLHPKSQLRTLQDGRVGYPFRTSDSFLSLRYSVPEDGVFLSVNDELSKVHRAWLVQSNQSAIGA